MTKYEIFLKELNNVEQRIELIKEFIAKEENHCETFINILKKEVSFLQEKFHEYIEEKEKTK